MGLVQHQAPEGQEGFQYGLVGTEAEAVWVVVPSIHPHLSFPLGQ